MVVKVALPEPRKNQRSRSPAWWDMYAEQRLKEGRAAAPSLQVCSDSGSFPGELSAREVCQVLRDVIFERHTMKKGGPSVLG